MDRVLDGNGLDIRRKHCGEAMTLPPAAQIANQDIRIRQLEDALFRVRESGLVYCNICGRLLFRPDDRYPETRTHGFTRDYKPCPAESIPLPARLVDGAGVSPQ